VVVPIHAPLPPLAARDVIGDLPAEAGAKSYGEPAYPGAEKGYYARCMRGGAGPGDELKNHHTWDLAPVSPAGVGVSLM